MNCEAIRTHLEATNDKLISGQYDQVLVLMLD